MSIDMSTYMSINMSTNLLGIVNVGWNSGSLLGVALAVAGAGLYFLRSVRPELSRDYDIFFAAVGLACGGILLFNGWRLDPILQFGQFLLALSTFFFAFETLRLRGLATEQAKRSTPIVDEDRPVSRSYRDYREPDYDELEPYRESERTPRKRLRGSDDDYEASPQPRRSRRSDAPSREDNQGRRYDERPSRDDRDDRRSTPSGYSGRDRYQDSERYSDQYDEWGEAWSDDYETETRETQRPRPRPETRRDPDERDRASRRSSGRPSSRPEPPAYEDEEPAPYVAYVDYDPADESDVEDEPTPRNRDRDAEDDASSREGAYAGAARSRSDVEDYTDDYPEEADTARRSPRRRDRYDDDYDYNY